MLDPDDPDKLDDEWILAQIMVLLLSKAMNRQPPL